jgi:HAD superfamily hydrolase (TIGR01509 family)
VWTEYQEAVESGIITEEELWDRVAKPASSATGRDVRAELIELARPLEDGVGLLEHFQAAGVRTGVASNHLTSWIAEWHRRFDWFRALDFVVCSEDVGRRKPDRRFFEALARRAPGDRAWFIDDRPENVKAAVEAGFKGVLAYPDDSPMTWELF